MEKEKKIVLPCQCCWNTRSQEHRRWIALVIRIYQWCANIECVIIKIRKIVVCPSTERIGFILDRKTSDVLIFNV